MSKVWKGVDWQCRKCLMTINPAKDVNNFRRYKGADPDWMYYEHIKCKVHDESPA